MKEYLEKLSAERCVDLDAGNTVDVTRIFDENSSLNDQNLYIARFRRIPNWIRLDDINCKKANDWFVQNYQDEIIDCGFTKYFKKKKGILFNRTYYFLFDDLLVHFYPNGDVIRLLYRKTDNASVEKIAEELTQFKRRKRRKAPEIELLINTPHGLDTRSMEISKPKFVIEDNYNDDFVPVHQTILNRLQKEKDKGLVLLHGKPGGGKTTYIRYLITSIKKTVIFLPPNVAACVTDPGLMNVLIEYPNSVLVIEDAENIVIDRNQSGSSSVSALLNLADGLLSDCLNIQIICSFNTDLSHVDSALTRKGRLIAKYEFGELCPEKAQALSNKLGFTSIIDTPMTLAAIYNQDETEFAPSSVKPVMGFAVAV